MKILASPYSNISLVRNAIPKLANALDTRQISPSDSLAMVREMHKGTTPDCHPDSSGVKRTLRICSWYQCSLDGSSSELCQVIIHPQFLIIRNHCSYRYDSQEFLNAHMFVLCIDSIMI